MWQVERKHETAGLVIRDTLRDETLRLMDIGLEASARPGFMFIGRLKKVEDFAMTCGISLLASRDLVEGFEATVPQFSERDRFKVFQNPRFATAMYRVAVKLGVFDRIREFDTDSGQDVAALAA